MSESTTSTRLVSINGDQYGVEVDGEQVGYVAPANAGGWIAGLDFGLLGAREIGVFRTRAEAQEAVLQAAVA